jgi:translation initiation factor 3 subunit M
VHTQDLQNLVKGLVYDQLERKMRLLVISALAFQSVGLDISYASIASTVNVDPSTVESWVIEGIFTYI